MLCEECQGLKCPACDYTGYEQCNNCQYNFATGEDGLCTQCRNEIVNEMNHFEER